MQYLWLECDLLGSGKEWYLATQDGDTISFPIVDHEDHISVFEGCRRILLDKPEPGKPLLVWSNQCYMSVVEEANGLRAAIREWADSRGDGDRNFEAFKTLEKLAYEKADRPCADPEEGR